ncbi:4-hydroxybenzoate octaprenyltransferase [Kaistia dalseonensis]|uniref:4-hydroxybenzoate octaprenyltransferase n=1 Tax=Kaistia dalseonensis TaxID=410840 RepID=A0ABU0HDT7_9HYPH|nr:4-hydroxybenzoate octaprenyltransferase [Kaistia dalseonensis]MCX5497370.1 4-hydroxybenzoate octaprenyltransferase [Kaistia dalseonensis]MDQ0440008.1 4-hydroxybenzoate polyprenyltransferase [Kaistia dalseonensis]
MTDINVADAVRGNWVDRHAPVWLRPYGRLARWDRPIGWWLLLLPCWWSSAMASNALGETMPHIGQLILFTIGAIAMRGAGCTYNDIVDRDLDAGVARTRSRPIPSGQVRVRNAKIFLVLQALVGLAVLLSLNWFSVVLGLCSLLVVAAYPFMKRITDWPQSVLGLAFSWGALMGWAAIFGSLSLAPLLLYAGGVLWTIGYDTIYALQDKEDDAIMGVRSTARLFGDRAPLFIGLFYAGAVVLWAAAFWRAGVGLPSYVGLGLGAVQLGWQVATVRVDDGEGALMLFKSNKIFGFILFAGLLADILL